MEIPPREGEEKRGRGGRRKEDEGKKFRRERSVGAWKSEVGKVIMIGQWEYVGRLVGGGGLSLNPPRVSDGYVGPCCFCSGTRLLIRPQGGCKRGLLPGQAEGSSTNTPEGT